MIRNCFSALIILALVGLLGFSFWQVNQLKQQNAALIATNLQLKKELTRHKLSHGQHNQSSPTKISADSVQDIQTHLSKAETAITQGNIGVAMSECKAAGDELQAASSSTSASVRSNLGQLRTKLAALQQQTADLLHKLGV